MKNDNERHVDKARKNPKLSLPPQRQSRAARTAFWDMFLAYSCSHASENIFHGRFSQVVDAQGVRE